MSKKEEKELELTYYNHDQGVEFLIKSGLLFEINRRILHPFGLELGAELEDVLEPQEEQNCSRAIGTCYVLRLSSLDDGQDNSLIYDDEMVETHKEFFQRFLNEEGAKLIQDRLNALGYVIQNTGLNEDEKG